MAKAISMPFLAECPIIPALKDVFKISYRKIRRRVFREPTAQYHMALDALRGLQKKVYQDYFGYLPAFRSVMTFWPDIFEPIDPLGYIRDFLRITRSLHMAWCIRELSTQIQKYESAHDLTIHAFVGLGHESDMLYYLYEPSSTPVTLLKRRFEMMRQYLKR